MKNKILLTSLTLLLCACSSTSNSATITVNEPLEYSVNIKDNAEFILIKEGTSIDEATQIILDNLDIKTNADSYEFDWYGEAYSYLTRDDVEKKNAFQSRYAEFGDITGTGITTGKSNTLNNDSIRPIELIFDFVKDDETDTYYKQILLCVAEDKEYNAISNNQVKTIEDAYIAIRNNVPALNTKEWTLVTLEKGYVSNLTNGFR